MLASLALGLIAGIVMALTGAGGGILVVPLLGFGLGLGVAQAGPIGLMGVAIAAAISAGLGLRAGTVRYKAVLLMAGAGILLSPAGVWLAGRLDARWLNILFAMVLLLVSYYSFQQARDTLCNSGPEVGPSPPCIRNQDNGRFIWTAPCAVALVSAGTIAGLLSGLLGVGGGFAIVPALRRYTDLSMQAVVSTSLAVVAIVAVAGVASSTFAGNINWPIALPFSTGALAGVLGGRILASRLAGPRLQQGFAALSALVAFGMVIKSSV